MEMQLLDTKERQSFEGNCMILLSLCFETHGSMKVQTWHNCRSTPINQQMWYHDFDYTSVGRQHPWLLYKHNLSSLGLIAIGTRQDFLYL